MTRMVLRTIVAAAAAATAMVPAVLVEMVEDRGGAGEVDTAELLAVSAVVALGAAVVAAVLFDRAIAGGHRRADVLIAAFDGVVVATVALATTLVAFLLLYVREEGAIGEGVGVETATWSTMHLVSLACGLTASRAALRWMGRERLHA